MASIDLYACQINFFGHVPYIDEQFHIPVFYKFQITDCYLAVTSCSLNRKISVLGLVSMNLFANSFKG